MKIAPRTALVGAFAAAALTLPAPSCSSDDGSDGSGEERVCASGQAIECFCAGGRRGAQRCRIDGSGFGPCLCDDDASLPDVSEDSSPPEDTPPEDTATPPQESDPTEPAVEDSGAPPEDTAAVDTGAGSGELGADCDRAGDCDSDICLGLTLQGEFHSVCAAPCCHEEECPFGFGCLQAGAGRYCLPSRIFPPAFTFTAPTGSPCAAAPGSCKSGICDASADLCRGTCCTDAECLVAPCHWSLTGSTLRTFCDPLAIVTGGTGLTGTPCTSELDCYSGVCAGEGGIENFRCADLCCRTDQCPAGYRCGLVGGFGNAVVRACISIPTGSSADGAECSDDGESCSSGHCVEGHCRSLCCTDADCTSPARCLPRATPDDILAPVCVDPEE